jgi:UDP-2-acetamido-2,6-beta-L-arabino-hexul-4-ose reductase
MIKVGITGQAGFVGTHLFNTLGLSPDRYQRIPFKDEYFSSPEPLQEFVKQCDVIVHLAALNRHNDPQVIYDTNVDLVKKLIAAMEAEKVHPHVLFSSSTQEECNNPYGNSKKLGRELLEQWAEKSKGYFTGLIIPNVYGPFGHPYYNSVIATFCHQLTHNEQPKIDVDGEIKLIYVGELVKEIIERIQLHSVTQSNTVQHCETKNNSPCDSVNNPVKPCETIFIPHTAAIKVSALLQKLTEFKENYFEKGIFPCLNDPFERNLFNTFVCYIDHKSFFPFHLKMKTDNRGSFVEIIKHYSGGQVSLSTTVPGITRGNHFHTRKAERFAVIKGKARIDIRCIGTDKVLSFNLDGSQPSFVDMPIWFTHNITNIGDEELYTIFWANEHYNPEDPDTFYEIV